MADSSINVTEGSGKRLQTYDHTVSSVLVQRQAVVLGEQPLASYLAGASGVSTATANSHLLQIMAGSSSNVRIRRIELWQQVMATTAAIMQVSIVRLSTAGTGGGAVSVNNLDAADAAAGATAMSLPTAKGTEPGTLINAGVYMMQTVAASAQLAGPSLVWDFDGLRFKSLVIAAGTSNGIALKNVTAIAAGTVHINVWLSETAW